MQILNQIKLTQGARTSLSVSRYRQYNMALAARMSIFLQDQSKGLATNTKGHENDAIRSPKADPDGSAHSNSKGTYDEAGSGCWLFWSLFTRIFC
jgi:hypothetical protein